MRANNAVCTCRPLIQKKKKCIHKQARNHWSDKPPNLRSTLFNMIFHHVRGGIPDRMTWYIVFNLVCPSWSSYRLWSEKRWLVLFVIILFEFSLNYFILGTISFCFAYLLFPCYFFRKTWTDDCRTPCRIITVPYCTRAAVLPLMYLFAFYCLVKVIVVSVNKKNHMLWKKMYVSLASRLHRERQNKY